MFVTPYAYNPGETGSMVMQLTGLSNRVELEINQEAYPVATIETASGSTVLTGNWPLLLDQRKNVFIVYYNYKLLNF